MTKKNCKIQLNADKMPDLLEAWLSNCLPMDFTVKSCRKNSKRIIEVKVQGTSDDDIMQKSEALRSVLCHMTTEMAGISIEYV